MAIQLRRGIVSDIIPAEILQGELVYYTDTGRLAIGNGGLNVIQTQLSPVADQQVQFKGYVTDLDGLYVGGAYKTPKGTGTPVTYELTSTQKATLFKSWLSAQYSAGTPVTVLYQLATPAASPNSTITASAGSLTVQYNQDIDGALALKANKAQEDWITPTLLNGCTHMASQLQYRKNQFGKVEFRGGINVPTSSAQPFTIPAGYRSTGGRQYITGSNAIRVTQIQGGAIICYTSGDHVFDSVAYYADQ